MANPNPMSPVTPLPITEDQIIQHAEQAITAVLHRNYSKTALQAAEALRATINLVRRLIDERDRVRLEHQETRGAVAATQHALQQLQVEMDGLSTDYGNLVREHSDEVGEVKIQLQQLQGEKDRAANQVIEIAAQLAFVCGTDTGDTERAARANLITRLMALEAQLQQLREEKHVPGKWHCVTCGFILGKMFLRASDGAVCVNSAEQRDICPNDGTSLVRLTWETEARLAHKAMSEWADKAETAEAQLQQHTESEQMMLHHLSDVLTGGSASTWEEICHAAGQRTDERDQLLGGFSLRELQRINVERAARWHADGLDEWTPMEWAGAMAGEAGEAVNAAKKLRRLETPGTINPDSRGMFNADQYRDQIGKEAADTVVYAALLCARIGVDLQDKVREVFNAKSEECGFPERLQTRLDEEQTHRLQTALRWQSIETAPKDSTVIMGFDPSRDDDDGLPHGVDFMRWYNGSWIDPLTHSLKPTHWKPLPAPPALTGVEGDAR